MSNDLTDLDGIGAKTADTLREQGIGSRDELVTALETEDPAVVDAGSRVKDAARRAALEDRGFVEDPTRGVRITEENRGAVETFADRDVTDLGDASRITRNEKSVQGESLLGLGRQAARGELVEGMRSSPKQEDIDERIEYKDGDRRLSGAQIRSNIAEMGFDAAANLTEFDRETVEEANRLRQEAAGGNLSRQGGAKTDFTQTETMETFDGGEKEVERDVRVKPLELAAAFRVHQARSPQAKRVDNQRKAPVTGFFEKWVDDPSRHDFPSVDTPIRGAAAGRGFGAGGDEQQEITAEPEYKADVDGFNVDVAEADGGGPGRIEGAAGEILSAPQEQQRIILRDTVPTGEEAEELGLEPRGPDKKLFEETDEDPFI